MLSPRRILLATALLLPGLALPARAQSTSPFLPPAAVNAPTVATAADTALELRGIMAAGDQQMFSIYDAAKKMSSWTRLNDTSRDFVVRTFDAARDTVTVDYQGRTLTLTLHTAKVISAPNVAPQVAAATPPGAAPQPIGGPVVLNPTPADEQRRLEAIAAEVNRRRMIRQQAIQANRAAAGQPPPPGQPPAGTPPPQQR